MSLQIPAHRTTYALRSILRYNLAYRFKHVSSNPPIETCKKEDPKIEDSKKIEDLKKIENHPSKIFNTSNQNGPYMQDGDENRLQRDQTQPNGSESGAGDQPVSLTQMVYKFFQKESQILRRSLDIDAKIDTPVVSTEGLPEHIEQKVQGQLDNYNRFLVLLSHHPLVVPPAVLLSYHSTLRKVEPADRARLFRHLIFNHRWADICEIYFEDDVTLNDMEDLVEQMYSTLAEMDDLFAIWSVLETARNTPFSSARIYDVLVETIQYRFSISSHTLRRFLKALDSLDGAQFVCSKVSDLDETLATICGPSEELIAYFFPRVLQKTQFEIPPGSYNCDWRIRKLCAASCREVGISNPGILKIPGFVSHAGKMVQKMSFPESISHLMHSRFPCMNSRDFSFVMQSLTSDTVSWVYMLFRRSQQQDEYVINAFLIRLHELGRMTMLVDLLQDFHPKVSKETWTAVFSDVAAQSDGMIVLGQLLRADSEMFASVLQLALSKNVLSTSVMVQIIEVINSRNSGRTVLRSILAQFQEKCSTSDLCKVYVDLCHLDLSEYNTTEIWRFGVTHRLLDPYTTGILFSKMLKKAWRPQDLEKRCMDAGISKSRGNFEKQYRHATKAERFQLLVRIQAIAESISTADEQYIVFILDNLHRHIFGTRELLSISSSGAVSDHPPLPLFFISNKAGKQYIFQQLVSQTTHFIYKTCMGGPNGVVKLSNILRRVHFKSTHLHASVYEHMVLGNPRMALKILATYKEKRHRFKGEFMDKVEQAILKSPAIKARDRLELFYEYQNVKASLGFTHKLATRTVALLVKLVFGNFGSKMDSGHANLLKRMAHESNVPVNFIRKWTQLSSK